MRAGKQKDTPIPKQIEHSILYAMAMQYIRNTKRETSNQQPVKSNKKRVTSNPKRETSNE